MATIVKSNVHIQLPGSPPTGLAAATRDYVDSIASGLQNSLVSSVGLSLPNIFSVTGSPVTTSGTLAATLASQTAKTFFAAPNGGNGTPSFRTILPSDIPTLNQNTTGSAATLTTPRTIAITGGVTGTATAFDGSANISIPVTAVAASSLTGTIDIARSWALTGDVTSTAGSSATTIVNGAVTLSKMASLPANTIIGNNTGSAATPLALSAAQVKTLLSITKADVGLSNVDNTSDLNKPISTATQAALNAKLDSTATAAAATKLATARTIQTNLASTAAASFDGTVNVTPGVEGTLPIANGGTGATTAAIARDNLTAASWARGSAPTVGSRAYTLGADDQRSISNPTSGLGYFGGIRARFTSLADNGSSPYADALDFSTYTDASGGGFNSLYFSKSAQLMQHKFASAGSTSWVTKTVAYIDSDITGSAAKLTTPRTIAITGDVVGTATAFDGSSNISIPVTSVNLSGVSITGTLPDARLSSNVALLNANQSYNGTNTFNNVTTLNNSLITGNSVSQNVLYARISSHPSRGGNQSGAIEIVLPCDYSVANFLMFTVRCFDYTAMSGFDVLVSGYIYPGTGTGGYWVNCNAVVLGTDKARNLTVRFGGATAPTIWIGELNSTWQYLGVSILNLSTNNSSMLSGGWSVGFQTTAFTDSPGGAYRSATATLPAAKTATRLDANVTLQTNLATTAAATFDGSANASIGVTGTLPVANGGTGATTLTGLVKGNGTAAFTAAVAGTDYVTPSGSITGNAATATTLQTARTINGTSFNGSANITTASWGTARTLTIGSTGKSVDGSANVSWTLAELGAAAASHTHTLNDLTDTTITAPADGDIVKYDSASGKWKNYPFVGGGGSGITWTLVSSANVATAITNTGYLMSTGGTARTVTLPANVPFGFYLVVHAIGGQVVIATNGNTITGVGAGNNLTIEAGNTVTLVADAVGTLKILSASAPAASIGIADVTGLQAALDAKLDTATGVAASATKLATARTIGGVSFDGTANINLPGVNTTGNQNTTGSAATLTTARTINGTSFNGSANITTASWGTARTITIGATGKSVDGSSNVSWTLAELGACPWDPSLQSTTSTATLAINSDTTQRAVLTAQAAALTISNPTGTPADGRQLMIVIKDNGTARAITFGSAFRGVGPNALPTTTKANKRLRMGFEWCAADSKWDLIALLEET